MIGVCMSNGFTSQEVVWSITAGFHQAPNWSRPCFLLFFYAFDGGYRIKLNTNSIPAIAATMLLVLVETMRYTARFIRLKKLPEQVHVVQITKPRRCTMLLSSDIV